jgi:hypothetical protein
MSLYGVSHTTVRTVSDSALKADASVVEFARCFLRLANLPNFALDRLSRYEATLWRQAGRLLYALETLDRRKPQERARQPTFILSVFEGTAAARSSSLMVIPEKAVEH